MRRPGPRPASTSFCGIEAGAPIFTSTTRPAINNTGDELETPDLANDFECFRSECIKLRNTFNTYLALYESDEPTDTLLVASASLFFHDLNEWLIHSIILQIGRLTDLAGAGERSNLTAAYFIDELKKLQPESRKLDAPAQEKLDALAQEIEAYRAKIKPARNKVVAHADRNTYQKRRLIPLSPGSQDMVFETCGGSDVPVMFRHACPLVI